MIRRNLVLVAVVVCVAGFAVWRLAGRGVAVEVVPVVRGAAADLVYATGSIEPVVQADIAPEVTGRMVELLADEGQQVKTGAALAKLDDAEQAAEVAQLQAVLAQDRLDLSRAETLWTRKSGSREDFDRARSQLKQDEAKLAAAQQRLGRLTLRAPMDGVVLRRDGEVGEILPQGVRVFTLGQPGALRATLEVDEEDIPQVHLGQKVLLSADAFPSKVFTGAVSEITPRGDPLNKSYRVRVQLPPDFSMPIGMTVEANLVAKEKPDALLIPATALVAGGVFVVDGSRVHLHKVETGITGPEKVEVLSGVSEGEQIVRQPPTDLQDGARVHVE